MLRIARFLFVIISVSLSTFANAILVEPPPVRFWETPFTGGNGGVRYTISVGPGYSVWAFGVSTDFDAFSPFAEPSGWQGDLPTSTQWNQGQTYEQYDFFGEVMHSFTTGANGIGSFATIFGPGSKAAVFWASEYYADYIGPNETDSGYGWEFAPPFSEGFALITDPNAQTLVCPVGLNAIDSDPDEDPQNAGSCAFLDTSTTGNGSIPTPGTIALFGLGLTGLGFARRKKA